MLRAHADQPQTFCRPPKQKFTPIASLFEINAFAEKFIVWGRPTRSPSSIVHVVDHSMLFILIATRMTSRVTYVKKMNTNCKRLVIQVIIASIKLRI